MFIKIPLPPKKLPYVILYIVQEMEYFVYRWLTCFFIFDGAWAVISGVLSIRLLTFAYLSVDVDDGAEQSPGAALAIHVQHAQNLQEPHTPAIIHQL